jgi:hypothetical protein
MTRDLVFDRRFDRMRALLPKLKLRYPNNLEAKELAELARVGDSAAFERLIHNLILDSHLNDQRLRNLSTIETRKMLESISKKASDLRRSLKGIDVGSGRSEKAGYLLEIELADFSFLGNLALIPEFGTLLDGLSKAAGAAARSIRPKRGPKGAGKNAAFNQFVEMLLDAARQKRGSWTIYKSADGKWTGSLLKALEILKPYLPNGFFPRAELGRSVQHITVKYKKRYH